PATWMEDIQLEINRHGFLEETHFTIAYSAAPDETAATGIGGVLATVHEISEKVVGERRIVVLRDLGAHAAEAKTAEEACQIAAATLEQHAKDVPFALLYLVDADGQHARLAASAGIERPDPALSPMVVALDAMASADAGQTWPLAEAQRTEKTHVIKDLASRFTSVPPGPWSDPPSCAAVVPIRSNVAHQLAGFLIAGVSPRVRFDDSYATFLELVSGQIATAIANARAYEEERKRAEALAAIDRAKTAFFSNVSHEFRTPLTLMLGPLEDALARGEALPADTRNDLELMQRNGLRLLKLVNTLLDFARIEAGRVQASYAATDLASYTAELASAFRSLVEKAGLRLIVECPPLDGALAAPLYVDREMWEKVVLNLLSNAFKFTFEGSITVVLRPVEGGRAVELVVRDTGAGIPAAELPRLFERFHRVEGTRARTHEGSGIGLALVRELVLLHGGTIRAESEEEIGTTFYVRLPTGSAHLPAERVQAPSALASTALGAAAFVEEAGRWLPDGAEHGAAGESHGLAAGLSTGMEDAEPARLVLADDNA
ncbi:MAG TPA: GAF domain-containing sensor histidine kinase, partial [Steroidobacteraceae bacterium]|nr:GAF domain-containing sensor histidine kinase [Steroidobacteraceae bacterium]